MSHVLASFPAAVILAPSAMTILDDTATVEFDIDKGYVKVSSHEIAIKAFAGDKYEYIRNFYIGKDAETGELFVNAKAAVLSNSNNSTSVYFGYEIGGVINIEGKDYTIEAAPNNNLTLKAV